jgi:hypothetical protein
MINTKRDRKNLYVRLSKINLKKKLAKLLSSQYHARMEDGKFVPNMPAMGIDAPWVYVKSNGARCDIYHRVFFNHLNIIPSYCRECYKIVVSPRTLVELFDLYELERETGWPCKCGIELRKTDVRLYGGYFYCRGVEQGRERYKEVRALVDEHLSPETPVILKRYCTEYEIGPMGQGASDQLPELTKEDLEFEAFVLDHFPPVGFGTKQPDYLTASVMCDWIHHAYMHGDPTYKEFTGGSPLFKPVVTYLDQEQEKV